MKPVNFSIKENQRITHNSIFADFALPHFESARRIHHAVAKWRRRTSVSCRELKTKLSKIDPFFLRYTAKPDLRHLSDQDRLDPEPGRTPTPRMGLVRLSRNTQDIRLQPAVKRKPEDFSRGCTRFYVNFAWVNFSSIPPCDGVSGRHVLQNLSFRIVRISNALSSFREIVWHMPN